MADTGWGFNWGTSSEDGEGGAWGGSGYDEENGDTPPGGNPFPGYPLMPYSLKNRYIRLWLKSTPLQYKRNDDYLISHLIAAIDNTDFDIGGSIE